MSALYAHWTVASTVRPSADLATGTGSDANPNSSPQPPGPVISWAATGPAATVKIATNVKTIADARGLTLLRNEHIPKPWR